MTISTDGCYVIIGGFSATVYVLDAYNLNVVYQYEPCTSSVRSLHMSHDHRLVLFKYLQ